MKLYKHIEKLTGYEFYPYQKEVCEKFEEDKSTIWLSARQMGKDTILLGHMIKTCLENENYTFYHVSHNLRISSFWIRRIQDMVPNTTKIHKNQIFFNDTGSRIIFLSEQSLLKMQEVKRPDELVLTECAYFKDFELFWKSIYPTLFYEHSYQNPDWKWWDKYFNFFKKNKKPKYIFKKPPKFRMASSLNNYWNKDYFFSLYYYSLNSDKINCIETAWNDYPDRDDEWKNEMINMIGKDKFIIEFNNGRQL
jgi:hypothetical protein